MSARGIDPDVERRLAELEAESDARRRQLGAVMQGLPAEVSRRDVIRDSVSDLRGGSARELVRRLGRTVADLPRRIVARGRASQGR